MSFLEELEALQRESQALKMRISLREDEFEIAIQDLKGENQRLKTTIRDKEVTYRVLVCMDKR